LDKKIVVNLLINRHISVQFCIYVPW